MTFNAETAKQSRYLLYAWHIEPNNHISHKENPQAPISSDVGHVASIIHQLPHGVARTQTTNGALTTK